MVSGTLNYEAVSVRVEDVLTEAFPNAAIETQSGFQGRVHVRIISPEFNGKGERDKEQMVWDALKHGLKAGELRRVSLVLVFGMDELP